MSKKIYASLDLETLADKMQEEIDRCWKKTDNPFFSPLVIFSDNKMEQWFKLRLLKKNAGKDSVILNLKTAGVENFLFDIASPKNSPTRYRRLPPELLRDVVVSKLSSVTETGGEKKFYAESLSDDVAEYLIDQDGEKKTINPIRLYDFSKEISALLIDYEVTRSEEISKADFWKKSPWQKKLSEDIFGDGGELEKIFDEKESFVTICRLAQKSAQMNGGKISFNWNPKRPVFIFGFCGMGQYYRALLNKFSESNDLYVFLQTPPNESASQNSLVKKWVDFGRCNLNLWDDQKSGAAAVCDENAFINKKLNESLKKKGFLTLTAAPSRLRETEALHSKICALLKNGARLGDILVLAPAIQEYKVSIEQVFDQTNPVGDSFPYVPYIFADSSSKSSLAAEALGVLFGILQKGYFSRSDLFSLLRNKLVQAARGISDEEVGAWVGWTVDLNVYRDRDGVEDWEKAKARLLLSRLSKDVVCCGKGQWLPYETLDSADDSSLYDFVQAVDELNDWLCIGNDCVEGLLNIEQVDAVKEMLEKWILPGDAAAEEDPDLLCEKYVFNDVIYEIECQKTIAGEHGSVNIDTLAFSLFDSIAASEFSRGTILSNAVTFSDFKPNRILSAKYVFFMGCDSKSLPGVDRESVLDLRKHDIQKGDDSIPARYKNAFLCQLMAAQEGFFISYVNKNLKKDEDFYMSSLVEDLLECLDKNGQKSDLEVELGIDEDRPWSELFTKRSFRNKRSFEMLKNKEAFEAEGKKRLSGQSSAKSASGENSGAVKNLPDRVTISKMKNFLDDPFVFMAKNLFSYDGEDFESERQEFEPLDFDPLTSAILRKELFKGVDESDFFQRLKNESLLPDSFFGEQAFEKIKRDCQSINERISQDAVACEARKLLEYDASANLLIKQEIFGKEKEWLLSGQLAWHNKNFKATKKIVTFELNNSNNCLGGYISALALLASLPQDDDDEYEITMYVVSCKDGNSSLEEQSLPRGVSRLWAQEMLRKIYWAMYVERQTACVPYSLVIDEKFHPTSLSDLEDKLLGEYGAWKYFSKKDLFNVWTDIGYTNDGFEGQWKEAVNRQIELMEFIQLSDEEEA